jgi:hypothetical protein
MSDGWLATIWGTTSGELIWGLASLIIYQFSLDLLAWQKQGYKSESEEWLLCPKLGTDTHSQHSINQSTSQGQCRFKGWEVNTLAPSLDGNNYSHIAKERVKNWEHFWNYDSGWALDLRHSNVLAILSTLHLSQLSHLGKLAFLVCFSVTTPACNAVPGLVFLD